MMMQPKSPLFVQVVYSIYSYHMPMVVNIVVGVIIYYELWMKGVMQADGRVDPPPSIIFQPSGDYKSLFNYLCTRCPGQFD